MSSSTPDPKHPEGPEPGASDPTTPIPAVPADEQGPIETLYAAPPASEPTQALPAQQTRAVPAASSAGAPPAPAVGAVPPPVPPAAPATPAAGASPAAPVGFTPGAGSPRRWSGRRTAAVAGAALLLGGLGAVGIAAALPHDNGSATIGDRTSGRGGQQGQWPGGPGSAGQGPGGGWGHDSTRGDAEQGWPGRPGRDHAGDDDGDGDHEGWRGQDPGQLPQGGTSGDLSQLDPNGGTTHTT